MTVFVNRVWMDGEIDVVELLLTEHIQERLGRHVAGRLADYHLWISADEHKSLCSKQHRILPPERAQQVLNLVGTRRLLDQFPDFNVSKVVFGNRVRSDSHEVYFRLVRPQCASDVGRAHADRWYHFEYGDYISSVPSKKVWIPVVVECGLNGLEFCVIDEGDSSIEYKVRDTEEGPRPYLDNESELQFALIDCAPGDALIFDDSIIHRGSVNRGTKTRVSVEITLLPNGAD